MILPVDERLIQRIRAEFNEMPGLRLTPSQAERLLGLDRPTCEALLAALVKDHFLWVTPSGAYARTMGSFRASINTEKGLTLVHSRRSQRVA